MRFALGIEYDGSEFLGWQSQRQSPTVQESVERALSSVADEPVRVVCAGRTDTGVHALGQVVHFDTDAVRDERSWLLGTNSNLPESVSALWIRGVSPDFHARFSAFERSYRYTACNRWIRPAVGRREMAWYRRELDAGRMHRAAQYLKGEHDFSAFRSAGCRARHAVREINSIEVRREGSRVILEVAANGFLYHMVRNIVGSLFEVGVGEREERWIRDLMDGGDRTQAGVTAPAAGLCLVAIRYPDHFDLPSRIEPLPVPRAEP
jgi:tRNA pseudouridine38-40 synthase